jgi:hypothetical protein
MDGTFFEQTKTGSWGFIIRDSEGDHAGSGAGSIEAVSETFHAEAYAYLHVVVVPIDAGVYKVKVPTDCLTLKTGISSDEYGTAERGIPRSGRLNSHQRLILLMCT